MDTISLKMPVTVKAKVTEKLKEKMTKELAEGIQRAELELQQLDIQEKRVMLYYYMRYSIGYKNGLSLFKRHFYVSSLMRFHILQF